MDLKATSFFVRTDQSSRIIQKFWDNASLFFENVISLNKAKSLSCEGLQKLISEKKTLEQTQDLFFHLENLKDLIIPSHEPTQSNQKSAQMFLSAYLFATNSEAYSEGYNEADERIVKQSRKLVNTFEKFSKFMMEVYSDEAIGNSEADKKFLNGAQKYLEIIHQAQLDYQEIFIEWDKNNVSNLAASLIHKYLQIESEKRSILLNADPRQLSLYKGYKNQQETLRARLNDLLGEEGLDELEEALEQNEEIIEENKWASASSDVLLHELRLNPKFEFSPEAYLFHPQCNVEEAIEALKNNPEETDSIMDVFNEIRMQLTLSSPNSAQWNEGLRQLFKKENIQAEIAAKGLESALLNTVNIVLEIIKNLEAPVHTAVTEDVQNELQEALKNPLNSPWTLLENATKFIYLKFSEIQIETQFFRIRFLEGLSKDKVVESERAQFNKRVAGKQFDHKHVLSWIENIIKAPNQYRFDKPILFSEHVGDFVARAIVIGMIEAPGKFAFLKVPETFYLDKMRMRDWHKKYQNIFCTLASLGFLETFCLKYGVKLSDKKNQQEKERLLAVLKETGTEDPATISSYVMAMLSELLSEKGKQISPKDMDKLPHMIERIYTEKNHPAAKLLRQRLSDQLNYYLRNGHLQDANHHLEKLHGLDRELIKLGDEISPVLNLHGQVHTPFYKKHIESRLWKDLFQTLQQHNPPQELPGLIAVKQDAITNAHNRIQRLAFVITGLGLLQQHVVFQDQWDLNAGFKYSELKGLANNYDLIQMVDNEDTSMDDIESSILALTHQVISEKNLDKESKDKAEKMIRFAKEGHSIGYRGVVRELVGFCKKTITTGEVPDINARSNRLIAEFAFEIEKICKDVQGITLDIKQAHLPEDVSVDGYGIPDIEWEPGKCGNRFGF